MKVIRYYTYGSPDVLRLQDVDIPEVNDATRGRSSLGTRFW
jgi:hypothetical protein